MRGMTIAQAESAWADMRDRADHIIRFDRYATVTGEPPYRITRR